MSEHLVLVQTMAGCELVDLDYEPGPSELDAIKRRYLEQGFDVVSMAGSLMLDSARGSGSSAATESRGLGAGVRVRKSACRLATALE